MYGDPSTIRRILTELGDTWAVVGLSNNEQRAAHGVAEVLQRYGKRIVPVHPKAEPVHGEQGIPRSPRSPSPSMWSMSSSTASWRARSPMRP